MTIAPSPTWQRVHLRSAALQDLLAAVETRLARGLEVAPLGHGDVPAGFEDLSDLLTHLQGTWLRRLQARLEQEWELGRGDHPSARTATARDLPGVRMLLDVHREHPALAGLAGAERRAEALVGLSVVARPA